jgi:ribonuclease VapC
MVVDSSALLAIALGEEDAQQYIGAIELAFEKAERVLVPATVVVESGIAAKRRKKGKELAGLLERIQPEIIPLTERLAQLSVSVFREFGKGIHKAGLNFGDCMSYATASYFNSSLLYKGNDFKRTPIRSAALTHAHRPPRRHPRLPGPCHLQLFLRLR